MNAVVEPSSFAWSESTAISSLVAAEIAFKVESDFENLAPTFIALNIPAPSATTAITNAPIPVAAIAVVNPPNAGIIPKTPALALARPFERNPKPFALCLFEAFSLFCCFVFLALILVAFNFSAFNFLVDFVTSFKDAPDFTKLFLSFSRSEIVFLDN